jgi:hypothetical protein
MCDILTEGIIKNKAPCFSRTLPESITDRNKENKDGPGSLWEEYFQKQD